MNKQVIGKTILTGIMTMAVCVLLLTATACIPRKMIQKNSELSAEYVSDLIQFPTLIGEYINSMQDNYSDTVLFNIIYCVDTTHPFQSVMQARYAQSPGQSSGEGYLKMVQGDNEVTQEYGRYWHGTSVILRLLLMVMPIYVIRPLFGAAGCGMYLFSCFLLGRKKKIAFAVCLVLGLCFVEPWMFFTSLEFSTAFVAGSGAMLFVVLKWKGTKKKNWMPFFTAVGVITCFVDFLTTETLTYSLPMAVILVLSADSIKESILHMIKNGVAWLGGYLSMFALKIGILTVVSGKEVMQASMKEGFFRLGGETRLGNISLAPTTDYFGQLHGAIWHNLACLYPVKAGVMDAADAWIPTLVILFAGLILVYLLHSKIDWNHFVPLMLLGLLPFLRFLVLSNHAYIHFFITYRALIVFIAVFLYFVYKNSLVFLIKK